MDSIPRSRYRVASRGALRPLVLGALLVTMGLAALFFAVTVWTSDLWIDWIGRDQLVDGRWVRVDPVTGVRVVWSLGAALIGVLLAAGGLAVLVQTHRSTTGRHGLILVPSGLRIDSSTTRFTIAWSRIEELEVSDEARGRQLELRCRGTDLTDRLGAAEVSRRERQLRQLLHPRVTSVDGGEIVRLAPLSALGPREAEFLDAVRRHVST